MQKCKRSENGERALYGQWNWVSGSGCWHCWLFVLLITLHVARAPSAIHMRKWESYWKLRCAACCSILRSFRIGHPLDLIPWVEFFKPILFRLQKIRGRSTRTVFRHKNDYYDCIGVVVAHQVCVRSMCSAFLCFFPHWNGKEITAAGWRLGSVYLQITAHFG